MIEANPTSTSRWILWWKTSFLMGLFYCLGVSPVSELFLPYCYVEVRIPDGFAFVALVLAIIHLWSFRYLNGKRIDKFPQTYVTTASNVTATLFGASLAAALAIAFTQCLWRLMRRSPMKVETIELLFTIRTNPFLLPRPAVIRSAPALFFCALLSWSTYIVTSFPPGALTVQSTRRSNFAMVAVPTFNASDVCKLKRWWSLTIQAQI